MSKHTPVPWKAEGAQIIAYEGENEINVGQANGYRIAPETVKANAHLMAAAPELLVALEQIERLSRESDGRLVDVRAMLGDIARAAVEKATGEQP